MFMRGSVTFLGLALLVFAEAIPMEIEAVSEEHDSRQKRAALNDLCHDASGSPQSGDPFEKPGDCDHFYQCSNGYLYTMPCAPGTAFNPAIGVCDWPYNVPGCGTGGGTGGGGGGTPPVPPVSCLCYDSDMKPVTKGPFEKPGDCNSFYHCVDGTLEIHTCPSDLAFNPATKTCDHPHNVPGCGAPPVCMCFDADMTPISTGPFEKPGDCNHYYKCTDGNLHTIACDPGTAFNPATSDCGSPSSVPGCGGPVGGTTPGTGTPSGPSCKGPNGEPLSTAPFEKPGSCTQFYQCGAGILYTHDCPSTLVFNPALKVCDWPYNVPGC